MFGKEESTCCVCFFPLPSVSIENWDTSASSENSPSLAFPAEEPGSVRMIRIPATLRSRVTLCERRATECQRVAVGSGGPGSSCCAVCGGSHADGRGTTPWQRGPGLWLHSDPKGGVWACCWGGPGQLAAAHPSLHETRRLGAFPRGRPFRSRLLTLQWCWVLLAQLHLSSTAINGNAS